MVTQGSWADLLRPGFGIDLGTANTVVCHPTRGVVLNEPSVMLVRTGASRIRPVGVGRVARDLTGRTPKDIVSVRPLRDGVITDLESARAFIVAILRRATDRSWERLRPRAVIGVPVGATTLEQRALLEAADEAGIGRPWLIPEPIAGALGSGIDPLEPKAHLVVDVGGGTAEVTAFCYGGLLAHRSCRVAGDDMTAALHEYLRRQYQITVGEAAVEDAKHGLDESIVVQGRDAASGRPKLITVRAEEAAEAIQPVVATIIDALATCLEDLPAQVTADIMCGGLLAFGGGSLMAGFTGSLESAFGVPVRLAERPLTCVAEGAAACLRRRDVVAAYGQH